MTIPKRLFNRKGESKQWNKKRQKNFHEAKNLFEQGKSKAEISKILNIRKPTIIKWLAQGSYQDNRGWEKGQARLYPARSDCNDCQYPINKISGHKPDCSLT
jgi:DNA invertase Pin-like site-specific DNA recombinase